MKRYGNLVQMIADIDNLRLACNKASVGKKLNNDVVAFYSNLDQNLEQIACELASGNMKTIIYRYFKIYEPKERLICATPFSDRIKHHAIMQICHPIFEKRQIEDSYASRPGKGLHKALNRAKHYSKNYQWFLKLDIRKYFDSIDHIILKSQLLNLFKDRKLLNLCEQIISSYQTKPGKGLPIGNLTSQYFANHYLAQADHFAKHKLKLKAYIRYMDDIIIWANDKNSLMANGLNFEEFINSKLLLQLKQFCINKMVCGLPCLGYVIFPNKIRLNAKSKIRFYEKLSKSYHSFDKSQITQQEFKQKLSSLFNFVNHADSFNLRKKILQVYE